MPQSPLTLFIVESWSLQKVNLRVSGLCYRAGATLGLPCTEVILCVVSCVRNRVIASSQLSTVPVPARWFTVVAMKVCCQRTSHFHPRCVVVMGNEMHGTSCAQNIGINYFASRQNSTLYLWMSLRRGYLENSSWLLHGWYFRSVMCCLAVKRNQLPHGIVSSELQTIERCSLLRKGSDNIFLTNQIKWPGKPALASPTPNVAWQASQWGSVTWVTWVTATWLHWHMQMDIWYIRGMLWSMLNPISCNHINI